MAEEVTTNAKACTRCQEVKPQAAFARNGNGRWTAICSACRNERRRARGDSARRRAAETPEARRTRLLWEMYRLTDQQYWSLLNAQGGACAICRREPDGKRPLAVDHCHRTGVVRALLCNLCNLMVGVYEQNHPAASAYLATYAAGNPLLRN
ncbi:endonuclease VII domain-containing protein [Streptomyces rubiginosohelvolus]|uniref:endonuclease VII domain-containing protein n=1 Tax=Streptomyces rubiginosohelvolus TaxID=67362 RepID=UPI0037BBE655